MPTPWPRVLTSVAIVISVMSHGAAAQDNGDEFSNNLASDLGPLIALFGEQFARQFMSQSMSWADNVLFACAPLGIIAAVVGAIRVGGPSWLKALIGRARETAATAELDLMSSTSHEGNKFLESDSGWVSILLTRCDQSASYGMGKPSCGLWDRLQCRNFCSSKRLVITLTQQPLLGICWLRSCFVSRLWRK